MLSKQGEVVFPPPSLPPPSLSRSRQTSNHGADGVEIGVKADNFPLSSFCVCVVHRILKRGLAIVVLVDGTSCVLRFVCFPAEKGGCILFETQYPNYPPSFQTNTRFHHVGVDSWS